MMYWFGGLTFVNLSEGSSTQFLPVALNVLEEWWERLGWGICRAFMLYLERNDIESVGVHDGGR